MREILVGPIFEYSGDRMYWATLTPVRVDGRFLILIEDGQWGGSKTRIVDPAVCAGDGWDTQINAAKAEWNASDKKSFWEPAESSSFPQRIRPFFLAVELGENRVIDITEDWEAELDSEGYVFLDNDTG